MIIHYKKKDSVNIDDEKEDIVESLKEYGISEADSEDIFSSLSKDYLYYISDSEVEGEGVFASYDIPKGKVIGVFSYVIDNSYNPYSEIPGTNMTKLGAKTNHQKNSNAIISSFGGILYLVSDKDIVKDSEIFIDYSEIPEEFGFDRDISSYLEIK